MNGKLLVLIERTKSIVIAGMMENPVVLVVMMQAK
jgi:hypothetical protein